MRKEFPVRINQTTSNPATTSLQPGEIPGGGTTVAPTGGAWLFLINKDE